MITKQPEIIKHRGYPVEIHHVITADHYVLELHRIPYGRRRWNKEKTVGRGRPVLLQHGVFASSAHWLIAPTNSSLGNHLTKPALTLKYPPRPSPQIVLNWMLLFQTAFRLADLGYDVWLGNTRGNVYSRQHLELEPNENQFWHYS